MEFVLAPQGIEGLEVTGTEDDMIGRHGVAVVGRHGDFCFICSAHDPSDRAVAINLPTLSHRLSQ